MNWSLDLHAGFSVQPAEAYGLVMRAPGSLFSCELFSPVLTESSDHLLFLFSFGEWSEPQWCPSGALSSFQLRVEPYQGIFVDDTSANNIRFRCSSNPKLEGPGMTWGEYGEWSDDCRQGGICGIQTKMEVYQAGLDDTSLNDVRFHCCTRKQK